MPGVITLTNIRHDNRKQRLCGVIGNPIRHSLSPIIHKDFAKQCSMALEYKKILGDKEHIKAQITDFFGKGGLGLNVTLPFKVIAFNMAKHATTHAVRSGVANTLWCNDNGELCADNTDGLGLLNALEKRIKLAGKRVLILGAGGASQGVIPSLLDAPLASLTIANRSETRLHVLSQRFKNLPCFLFENLRPGYDVIINATSSSLSGMALNVPHELFAGSVCMDMFYDLKQDTSFVTLAQKNNALDCMDGIHMLVGQAAESFQRWHHKKVDQKLTLAHLCGR